MAREVPVGHATKYRHQLGRGGQHRSAGTPAEAAAPVLRAGRTCPDAGARYRCGAVGTPEHPEPARRSRTPVIAVGAIALAAFAAAAVLVFAARGESGPSLNAEPVNPARNAPPTAGMGYDGAPVSAPTPGRPALVTFLFTECPDICPFIASTIRQALERAGGEADAVDIVAVSVDPEGDTPASVRAFLTKHGLLGRMDYIVGTRADLAPLWRAWMVAAQPEGSDVSAHSARIVLIDRQGRQVGAYAAGVQVPIAHLADDLVTLAREG
jgi:protein SCO1/2